MIILKKRANAQVSTNAFSSRIVDDWNSLPENVITSPSLNSF